MASAGLNKTNLSFVENFSQLPFSSGSLMAYPVSSIPVPTTIQRKLATQGITCLTDFIECLSWQDGFSKDALVSSVSRLKLSTQEQAILVSALDEYLVGV